MKTIGIAAVLAVLCATRALAADTMSRKPGLWEVRTSIEGSSAPARIVRQCIDAKTDRMLQSSAGPFDPAACKEQTVHKSAEATTTDFTCTVAGKPATAHSVASGNFDSAYTMTVTAATPRLQAAGWSCPWTRNGWVRARRTRGRATSCSAMAGQ